MIERCPWPEDFPGVVIHTRLEARDSHPDYAAAKAGDEAAASGLVKALLLDEAVAALGATIGRATPLITRVSAVEQDGFNAIPDAMALDLGAHFDLEVDERLIQSNKVGHTRSRAAHRLVTPARFAGTVRSGAM